MNPTARTLSAIAAAYGIGLGLGLLAFKGTPARPNPLPAGHSEVQSVILSKSRFRTATSAQSWLHRNGFKTGLDEKPNTWRARQMAPSSFSRLRTIRMTNGVQAVVGFPR